jgi:hypothetical protein
MGNLYQIQPLLTLKYGDSSLFLPKSSSLRGRETSLVFGSSSCGGTLEALWRASAQMLDHVPGCCITLIPRFLS